MNCKGVFLYLLPLSLFLPLYQSNKFSDCNEASIPCGSNHFNISFPFRVPGMPEYCGHPMFEVSCIRNSTLEISISKKKYKVKSIRYETQFITVSNLEHASANSCPRRYSNTSLDFSPYDYPNNIINRTMFFNCLPISPRPNIKNIPRLSNISSNGKDSYYSFPSNDLSWVVPDLSEKSSSVVLIPMYQNIEDLFVNGRLDFFGVLQDGFGLNWIVVGNGWCTNCRDSGGICGNDRNASNAPMCYCRDGGTTNKTCSGNGVNGVTRKKIIEGSAAGVGFLVVCLSLALCFYKRRKASNLVIFGKKDLSNNKKIEALLEEYGSVAPKRYSYSNVKEITKAFHEKLGQGGYGTVYKGTLRNGHAVAVKILNDSKGDGEEFINEVASICRTSHVNVVSLLGFCYEGSKKALIYDFMCNGSLEKLIYGEQPKTTHDWQKLYEIAVGIARGLEYLHRGCNTRIVHFDIKPHNILLDQNFCPKISDFGLAKLCLESIISIAGARGTIGYIAPEVFSRNFGVVSSKSDVYSYGMLVLDIVGGRKNPNEGVENSSETYFPHWIYAQLNQNGHLSTYGVTAESEEIARKMVLVGLWCIQTLSENRPSMSRVVEMMEGSVDDLQVPPKPYLSSSPFGSIIGTSAVQDVECSTSVDS